MPVSAVSLRGNQNNKGSAQKRADPFAIPWSKLNVLCAWHESAFTLHIGMGSDVIQNDGQAVTIRMQAVI
jgi:hypothetical protein